MNIVITAHTYYPNKDGVQVVTEYLAEGLVQKGHNVTVVTPVIPGAPLDEEHNGVIIHRVNVSTVHCKHKGDISGCQKFKECKNGFDFSSVSSHSMIVNANRFRIHQLAYNLFNWFRRLVLPTKMRRQQASTIRDSLLKIAARVVHKAGYMYLKLCSSCPYIREYTEALQNIREYDIQLE